MRRRPQYGSSRPLALAEIQSRPYPDQLQHLPDTTVEPVLVTVVSSQDREISNARTKRYGLRSTALARTSCKSLLRWRNRQLRPCPGLRAVTMIVVCGVCSQASRGRESGLLSDHVVGHVAATPSQYKNVLGLMVSESICSSNVTEIFWSCGTQVAPATRLTAQSVRGRSVAGCAGSKREIEGRGQRSSAHVLGPTVMLALYIVLGAKAGKV